MSTSPSSVLAVGLAGVLVAGCSSTDPPPPPPGPTVAIAKANPSGDGQTAVVASALPNPLRVVVTEGGSPVSDRTVAWSTASGSVTASSTTDNAGIATSQWTLGQSAGPQTASATLSGAGGSPVGFSASATAGPASSIARSGGDAQTGIINSALADPLGATAADQFGNPVGGVGVMWQVTSGTATVTPPSSNTGSDGEAQTVVTLGGTAGTIVIQAVSSGLTGSPLSYTATAMTLPTALTVQVMNDFFQPRDVIIAAGGTVTWDWVPTAVNHNVMPDASEPVRSGDPTNGPNTYQFTFSTPGTYMYYCVVHGAPGGVGMAGTVTVQ